MTSDEHTHLDSNAYSDLLRQAVTEVRAYQSSGTSTVPTASSDSLIACLEHTALLPSGDTLDQALSALGRFMVDEFPLTGDFAPSISSVLDARQRLVRQRRRAQHHH